MDIIRMTEQRKEGRRGQGEKKESGRRISEPRSYLGRKEERRGGGRKDTGPPQSITT